MEKDYSKAYSFILKGNVLYSKKNYKRALFYYLKAKKLKRKDFVANINCANANFMLNKYSKAIYYLKKLYAANTDNLKIISLLAQSYFELKNYKCAEKFLLESSKLDTQNPWTYNYLSQIYQYDKNYDKACEYAWKSIVTAKDDALPHQLNFGYLLYEAKIDGESEKSKEYADKWIQTFSDNPIAKYMGGAVLGIPCENSNALIGIRNIFDAFAPDFEKTLLSLEYNTPKIIGSILSGINIKKGQVLDIGCGTGLCGQYLQQYANKGGLYGVDISLKMLQEAKKKNIYSQLIHSDLLTYLSNHVSEYNLVAAADVLTYFGDLSALFSGVKNSLHNYGYFVFSVSKSSQKNILLHPSGRYHHSAKYISSLIKKYGFLQISFQEIVLRMENNIPVTGYIYLLQKI